MIKKVSVDIGRDRITVANRITIPSSRIRRIEIDRDRSGTVRIFLWAYTLIVILMAAKFGPYALLGLVVSLALWWWSRQLSKQAVVGVVYEKEPSLLKHVELMITESYEEAEKAARELLETFHQQEITKVRIVRNESVS